ncbi:hypothetical protein FEF34_17815 [Streptomyces marianii]|uniref:Uncharacterized protein n=1 Tax=Streptomyces marianii TaxID=1817406 RepID=A0A5R9E9L8_9ACTN|nr:hypothetical protein FEF34_17815 [Streptomyces marianii]
MERGSDSAEQLRAIEGAPVLSRAAGGTERALGVLSIVALFVVLAAGAVVGIPAALGCVVLLAALALVLRWRWFHLRAPGRRPHTKTEEWLSFFTPVALAIPGLRLLWNNPADLAGGLMSAAVPTAVLACYLMLRWRR